MPFDFSRSPDDLLHLAARASGLRVIDLDLLDRHKAAELRLHPPNWAYRHRGALQMGFGIVLIVGFLALVLLDAQGATKAALAPLAVVAATVIAVLLAPIRGPAQWKERDDEALAGVHPRVADAARRLKAELPDAELRVGELFQQRVKLDPYLIAAYKDARLLLGIWDGERLIACA